LREGQRAVPSDRFGIGDVFGRGGPVEIRVGARDKAFRDTLADFFGRSTGWLFLEFFLLRLAGGRQESRY